MPQPRIGGTFAPPLSDGLLALYQSLADSLGPESEIGDAMNKLRECCSAWWEQPESNGTPNRPHPSGTGTIVDLDPKVAKSLWDHIPWDKELDAYAALFDTIDPVAQKPLRDAAFHLLWHVKELSLDREPLTADKLPK